MDQQNLNKINDVLQIRVNGTREYVLVSCGVGTLHKSAKI